MRELCSVGNRALSNVMFCAQNCVQRCAVYFVGVYFYKSSINYCGSYVVLEYEVYVM